MRKILSLALASAMALSMASVAFAANFTVDGELYEYDVTVDMDTPVTKVGYGDTIAIELGTTEYDVAKTLSAKATWEQNGDYVESMSISKRSIKGSDATGYFLELKTKNDTTLSSTDVSGKIDLTAKKDNTINNTGNTATLTVFFTLGYDTAPVSDVASAALSSTKLIYKFEEKSTDPLENDDSKFAYDEEFEFTLYGMDEATFVVDTNGQGNILVANDVKYNEGLEAIFGDANYVYINGNGATFNRTGVLTIPAEEGQFLYAVKENGKLAPVKGAEYDSVEEAFVINTRTLGKYVIADVEYETTVVTAPVETVEAPEALNPSTGVAL